MLRKTARTGAEGGRFLPLVVEGRPPAEVKRSGISRTELPTDDAAQICKVGSGSVSQNVQAHGREVVSLAGVERPSRFVHSLPNRVLRFRGKGPQDSRG
jgi:hypothetical protein